ncbi:RHS repeat protein, partial [Odoribacter sp. OF09-27XD]
RLTEQGSSFFRLGLRYENAQKGPGVYGGDISEWSCRYGSKAEQLYTFSYDGAGRFTGGNHYENGVLVNKYVEQGIGYDKNGNILSLKRYSNGVLVDNLTYSYNGNSLSGLTESAVVASGDIYERKNVSGGSYDYDIYGNLSKDSRKNLNFEYNILNLLHNVREGSIIMAGYEYSYGGVK